MNKSKIIRLASSSPRRQQLLEQLDLGFTVHKVTFDESHPQSMNGREAIEYIISKKLNSALQQIKDDGIILCADTIVLLGDKILEKPQNTASAKETLGLLSGNEHQVLTAVAMSDHIKTVSFICESIVKFSEIPQKDIDYYVEKYNPLDKAGSYAIQEWIGHAHVIEIRGNYNNIMGLPTQRVYQEIINWD